MSLIFDSHHFLFFVIFGVYRHIIEIFVHHFEKVPIAIVLYLEEFAFRIKVSALRLLTSSFCPIKLREVDQFLKTETKACNVVTPSKSIFLMLPYRRVFKGACEYSFAEVNMLSIIN